MTIALPSRTLAFALLASLSASAAADGPQAPAAVAERVVAGSAGDFLEVRHIVLEGSNREIGAQLATFAAQRFHVQPMPAADPLVARAQRAYFAATYPAFLERMRGAAEHFGKPLDDDRFSFASLPYLVRLPPGCSVVFYPPGITKGGEPILSRNYDFTTGTLMAKRPPPGELAATARPCIVELHPTGGYASLALCAYDLLGAVIDGINSEGLAVALLADDEIVQQFPTEPALGPQPGLDELGIPRFLLDTCASVDEAKVALLAAKHYYAFLPCHYLVADASGRAFVFEYSRTLNKTYVFDAGDGPLVTTNFMLHLHDVRDLPREQAPRGMFSRYRAIQSRLAGDKPPYSVDFIKNTNACAAADQQYGDPPHRTLWHSLYFLEERRLSIDFYLRDEPAPDHPGKKRIVRSGYIDFRLP